MESLYSVPLGKLIEEFNLEVLRGGKDWQEQQITTEDVNRPGLQLTGFFDYFGEERLQVIGLVETSYLEGRTAQERRDAFDQLFQYDIPALIISRGWSPTRSAWRWRKSTTGRCCAPRRPPRSS